MAVAATGTEIENIRSNVEWKMALGAPLYRTDQEKSGCRFSEKILLDQKLERDGALDLCS
jgi:hypothetical protein